MIPWECKLKIMLNSVFFNLSLTGTRSCAEIRVSAACWLAPRKLHRYITNGAKMYVLSADEALMAIIKAIPVPIQGD
jgi:hypothetical protein